MRPSAGHHQSLLALAVGLGLAVAIAGCLPASVRPTPTPAPTPSPTPTPVPDADADARTTHADARTDLRAAHGRARRHADVARPTVQDGRPEHRLLEPRGVPVTRPGVVEVRARQPPGRVGPPDPARRRVRAPGGRRRERRAVHAPAARGRGRPRGGRAGPTRGGKPRTLRPVSSGHAPRSRSRAPDPRHAPAPGARGGSRARGAQERPVRGRRRPARGRGDHPGCRARPRPSRRPRSRSWTGCCSRAARTSIPRATGRRTPARTRSMPHAMRSRRTRGPPPCGGSCRSSGSAAGSRR